MTQALYAHMNNKIKKKSDGSALQLPGEFVKFNFWAPSPEFLNLHV
jgi:hypothetical protein